MLPFVGGASTAAGDFGRFNRGQAPFILTRLSQLIVILGRPQIFFARIAGIPRDEAVKTGVVQTFAPREAKTLGFSITPPPILRKSG